MREQPREVAVVLVQDQQLGNHEVGGRLDGHPHRVDTHLVGLVELLTGDRSIGRREDQVDEAAAVVDLDQPVLRRLVDPHPHAFEHPQRVRQIVFEQHEVDVVQRPGSPRLQDA